MKNTTLCYLERDGAYLMLHRVKKEQDENRDKWIGIGGKFEYGETPEECAAREIREETGLIFAEKDLKARGIVTFVSDEWGTEYMFLFTASLSDAEGRPDKASVPAENPEGLLEWVAKEKVTDLPIWEGDRIFLRLLAENAPYFSLKLVYSGDRLAESKLSVC